MICGNPWLNLDAVESRHGGTALHSVCAQSGQREILEILLKSGSHRDCVDRYGHTPIDLINDVEMKSVFLCERIPSKLKCLCARLIAKQRLNIDRWESSTSALKKFLVLHGYHSEEQTLKESSSSSLNRDF